MLLRYYHDDNQEACFLLLEQAKEKIVHRDSTVTGFNVGINDGRDAGQTVMHCHIHLIPRRKGDVTDPRGGIRHVNLIEGPTNDAILTLAQVRIQGQHSDISSLRAAKKVCESYKVYAIHLQMFTVEEDLNPLSSGEGSSFQLLHE